ncbi:hypothetical protein [Afipia broomeae]|uniref:Uncharacterized protein n=1 Tax=Afipia broomeae ATCC 49717 TaxID=883078 RepID=K8P3L0_9BRAD|nr:hypothetical protein [Afipia broomeae]EKS34240.1 hypothetical protein HMPREF9695_04150 [Afipia broomeae ATCC 49717]
MRVVPVTSVLEKYGLKEPGLIALQPNLDSYKSLLLQPHGELDVSRDGVSHRHAAKADSQFSAFLRCARNSAADICVTPEYSMPWSVLLASLKSNVSPAAGKIWVLGCESISYQDLVQLKVDNEKSMSIIFEDLSSAPGRFLDPLAYVFQATSSDGAQRLVVLVQFKTVPMGDKENFEVNNLQRGTTVYVFGNAARDIKMAAIICSDAFAFSDHAQELYDRALIIHIQLNPDPRNHTFRTYKNHFLDYQNDETEIVCLNWASGICHWESEQRILWKNIGGSAWYTKSRQCAVDDESVNENHRRGLYYTWLECSRTHSLFFNYDPSVYELISSKVYHYGVKGPISPRLGPRLTRTLAWNDAVGDWVEQIVVDGGFAIQASEAGKAKAQLLDFADRSPIAAERAITLCAGDFGVHPSWYNVAHLSSCKLDETEVVNRITYCQDPNAAQFRGIRLRRCGQIFRYVESNQVPEALSDLSKNLILDWQSSAPYQNAKSDRGRATLVNFGDDKSVIEVIAAAKRIANHLHQSSKNEEDSRNAKQRIAVWYQDADGAVKLLDLKEYTYIDRVESGPAFDIAGEA